jgi:hypothetical protein
MIVRARRCCRSEARLAGACGSSGSRALNGRIHQQDRRVGKRTRKTDALLHAARQRRLARGAIRQIIVQLLVDFAGAVPPSFLVQTQPDVVLLVRHGNEPNA